MFVVIKLFTYCQKHVAARPARTRDGGGRGVQITSQLNDYCMRSVITYENGGEEFSRAREILSYAPTLCAMWTWWSPKPQKHGDGAAQSSVSPSTSLASRCIASALRSSSHRAAAAFQRERARFAFALRH